MGNAEIYILCMMFGTETEILGAFTDKKELIEAYDKLLLEDSRCNGDCVPGAPVKRELPLIYRLPLNQFIGKKEEWISDRTFIFMDWIEEYRVDIREVREVDAVEAKS